MIAVLLCQILKVYDPMSDCDVQTLVNSAACFNCLSKDELQRVIAQLLCDIKDAGSVSSGCVDCGTVDPVAAPTGTCCVYYRHDNGAVWVWKATTASWLQVIAP